MRQSYRVTLAPSASRGRGEALRGAACAGLSPEAADRYMRANARTDPFAHATGRMVCAGCPVALACLAQAIAESRGGNAHRVANGIRGGESASGVAALAWRMRQERVPAEQLAREALAHQLPPLRGAYGAAWLRRGEMSDHLPLRP